MHNIESFLKSINFNDEDNIFQNVKIEKVVLNKKSETFSVFLTSENVLPYENVEELINSTHLINNEYKCNVYIAYTNITAEDVINYVIKIVERLVEKKPSLVSLLESTPILDDDIIIFEVISETEEENVKKEEANIRKTLASFGFKDYLITTKVNEDKRKAVETELEQVQAPAKYVEVKHELTPGEPLLGKAKIGRAHV